MSPRKRHWSDDLTARGWFAIGLLGCLIGFAVGWFTADWSWYGGWR